MAKNPEKPKRCPRCTTEYIERYCLVCTKRIENSEPLRKLTCSEINNEVRSWKDCTKDNLPVEPNLWARRMTVILGRDVLPSQIGIILELIGEAAIKHQAGARRRKLST